MVLAFAECFCGDTVPSGDGKANKCDRPCSGEPWEVCGGHSRINIYEFWEGVDGSSSSDEGEPTSLKDDAVEGALALGCYKDDKNNRVLDGHKFDDKTGMTAEARGLHNVLFVAVVVVVVVVLLLMSFAICCSPWSRIRTYVGLHMW